MQKHISVSSVPWSWKCLLLSTQKKKSKDFACQAPMTARVLIPSHSKELLIPSSSSACTWWCAHVMGWEAELDYSFPLDLQGQESRVDWVICLRVSTVAGSPKTWASLPGESWLPQWRDAGSSVRLLVQVQEGIEWHSSSILLWKRGVWFLAFQLYEVSSVRRRRCSRVQRRNIASSRTADLIWGNDIRASRLIHCTATVKLTAIWNSEQAPIRSVWPRQSVGCWQD